MAGRNENGNRRQKSKLDKCIDATSEIRLIGKRVSLVRDVLNGALEGSQERETKKKIRLSIEALQRDIVPSLSSSANVVKHGICHEVLEFNLKNNKTRS